MSEILYFAGLVDTPKRADDKFALAGRSSYFYRTTESAHRVADKQNARAESLGLKARYAPWTVPADELDAEQLKKEVRD